MTMFVRFSGQPLSPDPARLRGGMMRRVISYSGGIQSWATAVRVIERHGRDDVTLLFADTTTEHPDLYRFLRETVSDLGCPLVTLRDGRTPWQVNMDSRWISNTRRDPCSRILKREPIRRWLEENCDPDHTMHYIGFAWDEWDRFKTARERHKPWIIEAPLLERPHLQQGDIVQMLRERGVEPPTLTLQGFPHNNCGGACFKAGQAQWAKLLKTYPQTYRDHERDEEAWRLKVGKQQAILRDRRNGQTAPMTLRQFRKRLEAGQSYDLFEWGGCACMEPGEQEEDFCDGS